MVACVSFVVLISKVKRSNLTIFSRSNCKQTVSVPRHRWWLSSWRAWNPFPKCCWHWLHRWSQWHGRPPLCYRWCPLYQQCSGVYLCVSVLHLFIFHLHSYIYSSSEIILRIFKDPINKFCGFGLCTLALRPSTC